MGDFGLRLEVDSHAHRAGVQLQAELRMSEIFIVWAIVNRNDSLLCLGCLAVIGKLVPVIVGGIDARIVRLLHPLIHAGAE